MASLNSSSAYFHRLSLKKQEPMLKSRFALSYAIFRHSASEAP
jgi:hypothetical protein